ncbi:hypothetical protein [Cryobacterium sp. GrIS_2_6]|nr:hypothetical protein [Cryobacterium psychrotolerans]
MEIYVSYQRKKFDAGHEAMIHTVRGSGYSSKLLISNGKKMNGMARARA